MTRFVFSVLAAYVLGWVFEKLVFPWMRAKLLRARMSRELEQRRRLRQIMEPHCICDWSDHETLIRDPDCKATDHGLIAWQNERLMSYLHANCPTLPYKFRGK